MLTAARPLRPPAPLPQDLFEQCVAYDRRQRPAFRDILLLLEPLVERAEEEAPLPPSPGPGSPALGQLRSSSFRASFGSPTHAAPGSSSCSSSFASGGRAAAAAAEAVRAVGMSCEVDRG